MISSCLWLANICSSLKIFGFKSMFFHTNIIKEIKRYTVLRYRPISRLKQYKLNFYAVLLSANLWSFNAANLILLFFSRFSSNGLRQGPARLFKNDRNDFDVKGTSCNASIFKKAILVGCSALVHLQCNNKSQIACKCIGKYFNRRCAHCCT